MSVASKVCHSCGYRECRCPKEVDLRPQPPVKGCSCGGYRRYGMTKFSAGHADDCPWSINKKGNFGR